MSELKIDQQSEPSGVAVKTAPPVTAPTVSSATASNSSSSPAKEDLQPDSSATKNPGSSSNNGNLKPKQIKQILPYETESLRLKHKCKDLKQKILDLELQNELRSISISRAKNTVKRLRFEYALLLESLERKALGLSIPDADRLVAEDLDQDNIDSLRLQDITRLLTETPLAMARSNIPPSANIMGSRNGYGNNTVGGPSAGQTILKRRRGGNGLSAAKRRLKDPNLPKRPTNAYLIFCDLGKEGVREEMEAKHPGMSVDMSKAMTEAWKQLDQEGRKPYYELYEKDKLRYQKEIKEYTEKKQLEKDATNGAIKHTPEVEEEGEEDGEGEGEGGEGEGEGEGDEEEEDGEDEREDGEARDDNDEAEKSSANTSISRAPETIKSDDITSPKKEMSI
ncbi:DEKNAAC100670 [Brettanomyces naardenensis]|uniref:DEKNAAC100670 n=1 Tax=Brettanomyces naardenensis TaxID=13370 RepID=A0A448YEW9_BRENA|nr:DEKNAAC100670 [Brettanomyces naardenensis]